MVTASISLGLGIRLTVDDDASLGCVTKAPAITRFRRTKHGMMDPSFGLLHVVAVI